MTVIPEWSHSPYFQPQDFCYIFFPMFSQGAIEWLQWAPDVQPRSTHHSFQQFFDIGEISLELTEKIIFYDVRFFFTFLYIIEVSSLLFNFSPLYSVSCEIVLKNACIFCYYLFCENQTSVFDIVFNFYSSSVFYT